MSGTGFSTANQPNGSTANNQTGESAEPTVGSSHSQLPDFAAVLGMSPTLASLSSAHPAAQATGLIPPTFNLFSTPPHSMDTLPKTGFTPLASALGAPGVGVGVGVLEPGAEAAALVAAVNAARASVEAAGSRPAMVPVFPGSTPAAEFRDNIQLALEGHLPRLEALARAVIEGIEKAYHPQVNSNRTAQDLALLVQAIDLFYNFLKETGVGALPLLEPPSLEQDGTALEIANDLASTNDEVVKKKLDSLVEAQFAYQRRVKDRAGIVSNLLQRG